MVWTETYQETGYDDGDCGDDDDDDDDDGDDDDNLLDELSLIQI